MPKSKNKKGKKSKKNQNRNKNKSPEVAKVEDNNNVSSDEIIDVLGTDSQDVVQVDDLVDSEMLDQIIDVDMNVDTEALLNTDDFDTLDISSEDKMDTHDSQ